MSEKQAPPAPSRFPRCASIVALFLFSLAFAAPSLANNTFPGTTITGSSGTFTATNIGADGEGSEPSPPGGGTLDTMWYSWTAPASGTFIFGTCNPTASTTTNFDTTIRAYTGAALAGLAPLNAGNDDTTGCNSTVNVNWGSTNSFAAVSGTTYRLQVDGFDVAEGNFHFHYGLVGLVVATTDASATEGGDTGAFTVSLTTVPTANVTVTIGASAQCTFAATTLTFTLANWATPQTVTATATNDAVVEGVHSCAPATITAANGGFAGVTATPPVITVNDNDVGSITIVNTDAAATEAAGNTGAFTVRLGLQPSASVTVTIGTSAQCTYAPTPLTFTTSNWNVTQTVTVTPINDLVVEGPHTCSPASITAAGGSYDSVTGTPPVTNITDNDSATVTVANTTNAAEPATNGVMTLTQTAVSSQNTVINYTVGGTAASGTDFTALSGTVTIPAGATTATISIPVLDDAIVEGGETVVVTLTSVSSGLATLGATLIATNTIADNDSATVTIANTTNAAEPATDGVMTLTQTAVSSQNTVINYTVGGTAASGTDYTALSGTVTILAGATTAAISIPVIDDLIVDPGETVVVTLTSVTSGLATLGATLIATNIISDNDVAAFTIAKTVDAANISAPSTLTYTITIDNTGNVPLTGLIITDTLLQGGSPRTLTSGPAYASGDANTDNILDASETWFYSATYAVPQGDIDIGTAYSNTATFDTAETSPLASNAAASAITQTPSISVTKSANVASVNFPGDAIFYSVLVSNSGNVTATAISVADTLATLVCPTSGNDTIAALTPGGSETCTVSYPAAQSHFDTNGGGDGDIDNTATASGTAAGSPVSDDASTAVTLTPSPLLTIDKTADTVGPLTVGQVINYTYTVTNTGNVTISSVDVNETAFNGLGAPVPSPIPGGPTTLAPGGILAFSATYTVTQADIDQLQ